MKRKLCFTLIFAALFAVFLATAISAMTPVAANLKTASSPDWGMSTSIGTGPLIELATQPFITAASDAAMMAMTPTGVATSGQQASAKTAAITGMDGGYVPYVLASGFGHLNLCVTTPHTSSASARLI